MQIGIAGGGLIGGLLAWRLARSGQYNVSVYEARTTSDQDYTSYHAAAMLAPYSEAAFADPALFALATDSLTRWTSWLAELEQDSGKKVAFNKQGSIITAHPSDECDLQQFEHYLRAKIDTRFRDSWRALDKTALLDLEPELTHFHRGIYLAEEACIDNRALLNALREATRACGGSWYWGAHVHSVTNGRLYLEHDVMRSFDWACDCRGMGAAHEYPGLRPVCGEVIRVHCPEAGLSRPVRILHPRYSLYVVPHPRQIYVIGATEIESNRVGAITVRSTLELLSALFAVSPAFAEATVIESVCASRPTFSDHLPRKLTQAGLLRLNGFYRHGYLLAPRLVDDATKDLQSVPMEASTLP